MIQDECVPLRSLTSADRGRSVLRIILSIVYASVGTAHLVVPRGFLGVMPAWVPYPYLVILGTGLCELAGATALFTVKLRRAAGVALALYAICVFPANLHQAMRDLGQHHTAHHLGWWYHAPRLCFQPVFVWWALFAGEVISWPFRSANQNRVGSVRAAVKALP